MKTILLSITVLFLCGASFFAGYTLRPAIAPPAPSDPLSGKAFAVKDYAKDPNDFIAVKVAREGNERGSRMTFQEGRYTWEIGGEFRQGVYSLQGDTLRIDTLAFGVTFQPDGIVLDAPGFWFRRKLEEVK